MIELLQSCFRVNEARLTVAGKCGQPKIKNVQVVEGVGLVAFSFQFITRLAAVFAEEVGGFRVTFALP